MLNTPAYRIFISSTAEDLKIERQLVEDIILETGHIPVIMRTWPASTTTTLDFIRDEIGQSDIIVSIIGYRYGGIIEDQKIEEEQSYAEFEYRYASELGKPILAFLLDPELADKRRSQLKTGELERRFDAQFKQFRNHVQHDSSGLPVPVGFFKNKMQLVIKVMSSLQALTKKSNFKANAPGLIPADITDTELELKKFRESGFQELYSTPFIKPTVQRLTGYKLLFKRVREQSALKRELANFFWHFCFPGIWKAGVYRLFFESGSTIAYVAERFLRNTAEDRSWEDYWPKVSITTNNLLVFLQFLFTSSTVTVELRPYGRPDKKYGATYGPIESLLSYDPGKDEPLDDKASLVLPKLVKHLLAPASSKRRTSSSSKLLILAAASGVNCADSPRGPHVGSYRNKIFKRALLMTGMPIVFFVDESKFLEESKLYNPTRCFAVCDNNQLKWDQIVEERSVAFCVAASSPEKRSAVGDALHALGLNWSSGLEPRGDYTCLPFLMSNQRFKDDFKGIPLEPVNRSGMLS
jgi:hypothetical protein